MRQRGFASDNNSGIHPEILKALEAANNGHSIGYGDDMWTGEAVGLFKKEFGDETEVFFVLTGTGANILGIQSAIHSFHAVICAETAHIQTDECGAPEKFTGSKLIPIATKNGKITPEQIKKHLHGFGFEHHSQPGLISITQVTELGTVYTVDEIRALADLAHGHGMFLHMDGARISNAAVSLGLPFRTFTKDAGVDILSFGGTKNGMMIGEAVLFFSPGLALNSKYYRKQAAQLYSKMRFVGAQFVPYLRDGIWKINATHSNRMAKILETEVRNLKGVEITQPVDANGVFAIVPKELIPQLQNEYFFYMWDELRGEVRWMTSFDTTEEDILNFAKLLRKLLKG
ncbi:MAG: low specificity L-threonine aldolase [Bacteroidia bacterium]|nr:low specificity L-threonine aldolase [Bacteroidia bacterium]